MSLQMLSKGKVDCLAFKALKCKFSKEKMDCTSQFPPKLIDYATTFLNLRVCRKMLAKYLFSQLLKEFGNCQNNRIVF